MCWVILWKFGCDRNYAPKGCRDKSLCARMRGRVSFPAANQRNNLVLAIWQIAGGGEASTIPYPENDVLTELHTTSRMLLNFTNALE